MLAAETLGHVDTAGASSICTVYGQETVALSMNCSETSSDYTFVYIAYTRNIQRDQALGPDAIMRLD